MSSEIPLLNYGHPAEHCKLLQLETPEHWPQKEDAD